MQIGIRSPNPRWGRRASSHGKRGPHRRPERWPPHAGGSQTRGARQRARSAGRRRNRRGDHTAPGCRGFRRKSGTATVKSKPPSNALPRWSHAAIKGEAHAHAFQRRTRHGGRNGGGLRGARLSVSAITDHRRILPRRATPRSSVKRQADEIAAVRAKYPAITILHGCEVDILLDGRPTSGSHPAGVRHRPASLHESGGQPPDQLMRLHRGNASFDGHDHHAPDRG